MGASTPGHPGARGEKDDVMTTTPPVQDWASDFDVLDPDYVACLLYTSRCV